MGRKTFYEMTGGAALWNVTDEPVMFMVTGLKGLQ